MEWILSHWSYIVVILLAADKVVAATPTPWDDIILSAIKSVLKVFNRPKPGRKLP